MNFLLVYEKRFFKDLDKIPDNDVRRIVTGVENLAQDPMPKGFKKLNSSLDVFRFRQGDYRVIYEVDFVNKTVRVLCVRHRKDVYKSIP